MKYFKRNTKPAKRKNWNIVKTKCLLSEFSVT